MSRRKRTDHYVDKRGGGSTPWEIAPGTTGPVENVYANALAVMVGKQMELDAVEQAYPNCIYSTALRGDTK